MWTPGAGASNKLPRVWMSDKSCTRCIGFGWYNKRCGKRRDWWHISI